MEITQEQAEGMLYERIKQYPVIVNILSKASFDTTLVNILETEEVDRALLPVIKNEVLVILAFYAPLSDLGKNITETTGIPLEKAESISLLVETLLLSEISNDLYAFEYLWAEELKKMEQTKNLNSAPQVQQNQLTGEPRPLTREELMQKLTPRRTMVADVASVQHQKGTMPQSTPPRGYDAYTKNGGGV
jgi:hypothetical protein